MMKNKIAYLNDSFSNVINGTGIDKFKGIKKYLSTESIKNNRIEKVEEEITIDKRPSRANVQPKCGDVLFARMQNTEKVIIIDERIEKDYIFSTGFMSIKPKEDVLDSNYLSFFFKSKYFNRQKDKLCNGGTQKALNNKSAENITFPLPDFDQQKQIAKTLDKAQELIDLRKESIAKLDELAKSIFIDMFGDPVSNHKGWEVKKLGKLMKVRRGASPRPISQFTGGTIPWIKIGDATKGSNLYIEKTKEHIIEEGKSKSVYLEKGSLVFANCGVSLGFCRILKIDGCIHDGWLSFEELDKSINSIFILNLINHSTQKLRDSASGGTQPNLNTSIMKDFDIYLPPIELQNKFASIIEKIEEQKSLYEKELGKLEENFQALLQQSFGE